MGNPHLIKKIIIRNDNWITGLKKISLLIGKEDNNKWYKLCNDINNIKKDDDDDQSFSINCLIDFKTIYYENLSLIKLVILQNHGSRSYNYFYEFSVYGNKIV